MRPNRAFGNRFRSTYSDKPVAQALLPTPANPANRIGTALAIEPAMSNWQKDIIDEAIRRAQQAWEDTGRDKVCTLAECRKIAAWASKNAETRVYPYDLYAASGACE